jgi:hypothetical protein
MTRPASRLLTALTCCALGLLAGAKAGAQNLGPSPEAQCLNGNAIEVSFDTLAAFTDRYVGKCVQVSGLRDGPALFNSAAVYYRLGPVMSEAPTALKTQRIGLYDRNISLRAFQKVEFVSVIGVLGQCDKLYAKGAAPVTGYCHYTRGPYINVATITAAPLVFRRPVDEVSRRSFGNLKPLSGVWLHRSVVEPLVVRWMSDLQKADVEDFARLNDESFIDLEDQTSLFYAAFVSPNSAFAAFRGRAVTPVPAFFAVDPPRYEATREFANSAVKEFVACFCRESRCEGRWPISTMDAMNADNRPYACLRVSRVTKNSVTKEFVRTELDYRFVEEPEFPGRGR